MRNFYQEFGLYADFTGSELKTAYKARLRQCHPDVAGDSPETTALTADLNHGYEVLSDPAKRQEYDAIFPEYRRAAPLRQDGWAVGGAGTRAGVRQNRSAGVWDPVTGKIVFPNGESDGASHVRTKSWDDAAPAGPGVRTSAHWQSRTSGWAKKNACSSAPWNAASGMSGGMPGRAGEPSGTVGVNGAGAARTASAGGMPRPGGVWDPVARRMVYPPRQPIDIPDKLKAQMRASQMERSINVIDRLKSWSLRLALADLGLLFLLVLVHGDGGHLMEKLASSGGDSRWEYWLPILNAWFAVHIRLGLPVPSVRRHLFWTQQEFRRPGKVDFVLSVCAGGIVTLVMLLKILGGLFA